MKEIEELKKELQEKKEANEAEHAKAMRRLRAKEIEANRREFVLSVDTYKLRARIGDIEKKETELARKEIRFIIDKDDL